MHRDRGLFQKMFCQEVICKNVFKKDQNTKISSSLYLPSGIVSSFNNNGQLHKKHIIPVAAKDQEPSPNCLFLHCLFIQFQSTYPAGPVAKLFDGGVHTGENTRATRIVTRTSNRLSIVPTFSITMFLVEPPRYFS